LPDQKNQKSSISDRLRAAVSPTRPGAYLSGYHLSDWCWNVLFVISNEGGNLRQKYNASFIGIKFNCFEEDFPLRLK